MIKLLILTSYLICKILNVTEEPQGGYTYKVVTNENDSGTVYSLAKYNKGDTIKIKLR